MGNTVMDIHDRNLQRWLERDHCTASSKPLSGRLIFPVSGLGYRTASQRGITNPRGEFRYRHNEQVTFYLGEVELPAANAVASVTPYDMGRSPHEPANVARLLQSLCTVDNGALALPVEVARHACQPIDFSVDPRSFALQHAVVHLLGKLGCTLLDAASAIDNLDAMLAQHIQDAYLNTDKAFCHHAPAASNYRLASNDVGEKQRY